MQWAATHLPVPQVLAYGSDGAEQWLLTAALAGVNGIDDTLRADPPHLVPILADGLRRLHVLPVAPCPFDSRTDVALRTACDRVEAGLVTADDLHSDHGKLTATAALAQLLWPRPQHEDLVVCHGDYCLPNVQISNAQVSGYVDLGKLVVADRWWDLAVATWSVTWNLGPGWEDLFLDVYGVRRDPGSMTSYRELRAVTVRLGPRWVRGLARGLAAAPRSRA